MNPAVPAEQQQPTMIPWYKNPGLIASFISPIVLIVNQRYGVHLSGDELAIVISGFATGVLGLFGHTAAHNAAVVRNNGS